MIRVIVGDDNPVTRVRSARLIDRSTSAVSTNERFCSETSICDRGGVAMTPRQGEWGPPATERSNRQERFNTTRPDRVDLHRRSTNSVHTKDIFFYVYFIALIWMGVYIGRR